MPEKTPKNLEAALERHLDDVYGYVAYRLAPDRDAAQDVTQDVFVAALNSWDSYRGDGVVLSWLRAIARHKVADHLRKRSGNRCKVVGNDMSALPQARYTESEQRAIALAQLMRTLRPQHVELIEEKYLEGLSVSQMAQKHGKSQKAIESALSRAREALRNAIARQEAQQERRHENS